MKAEDLIKKNPYSLRICEKQSYLMGLGNIKDYEILHDGLAIRKLTMSESDATEITNLLNYSFINGVTQSILISDHKDDSTPMTKNKKKDSTKLNVSKGTISGVTGSINGTDGSFYSTGGKMIFGQLDNHIIRDFKNVVKIDGDDYLSISDLIGFIYLPKGTLVKVADLPSGDIDFWLSSGKGIKSYSNRRILDCNIVNNNSKSYIWTSPFATDAGKRLDNIKLTFVAINTVLNVNKNSSSEFNFPMGI